MTRTLSSRNGRRRNGAVRLLCLLLLSALVVPAHAQQVQPPNSIGIRLVEIPTDLVDNPRATSAIIDHVDPETTIERRFEVVSTVDGPTRVRIYATAAEIVNGVFTPLPNDASGVNDWVSVSDPELALGPLDAEIVSMRIDVPADAPSGEFYGVLWVEPPAGGTQIAITNRVGLRIYLSVGSEDDPPVDFSITEMTAGRDEEGVPYVTSLLTNTGERAVDVSGELDLEDGPAGLESGPYPFDGSVSIAPGDTAPMRITLDPDLPDGPWTARLTARSGLTEREAFAEVTFPTESDVAQEPVEATPVRPGGPVGPAIAGLLLLLTSGILFLVWRRRREEDDGDREAVPVAPTAPDPAPDPDAPAVSVTRSARKD